MLGKVFCGALFTFVRGFLANPNFFVSLFKKLVERLFEIRVSRLFERLIAGLIASLIAMV